MNSIKDVTGTISWTKPGENEHRLENKAGLLGTITWTDNDGKGETADGKWTFHKHGFLNPHVVVRDVKTGKQVGRFEAAMSGGGVLELTEGRHFKLAANTWKAEWRWLATAGDELVTYDFIGYAVDGSPEGRVEIHEKAHDFPSLSMLLVLGCYLIHLIAESAYK